MKCLACGAEMRLMQVEQRGDPALEVVFERHTFKCSACPQISQRLVFSRPRSPLTDLSFAPPSKFPQSTDLQVARLAGPTPLAKVAENLRNKRRRISIQARAVAPEGFKHERQDAPVQERRDRSPENGRISTWAEAVEKVRTRQIALQNRAVALSPLRSTAPNSYAGEGQKLTTCAEVIELPTERLLPHNKKNRDGDVGDRH